MNTWFATQTNTTLKGKTRTFSAGLRSARPFTPTTACVLRKYLASLRELYPKFESHLSRRCASPVAIAQVRTVSGF